METQNLLVEIKHSEMFEVQSVSMSEEIKGKNPVRIALFHALRELHVSKEKCIFIPKDKINTPHAAVAAVAYARKQLISGYPAMKDVSFSTKTIRDVNKNYLGVRVWKTNQ